MIIFSLFRSSNKTSPSKVTRLKKVGILISVYKAEHPLINMWYSHNSLVIQLTRQAYEPF